MLRTNTESFAPELLNILSDLGVEDEVTTNGFQLLKFERIQPDVFAWLLRGANTYIVTLRDGGSVAPDIYWLASWAGGLTVDDFEVLAPKDEEYTNESGIQNGYDYVQVYLLPKDYDHDDHIQQY